MARSSDDYLAQIVAQLALANARLSAALDAEREKVAKLSQPVKPEGGA